MSLPPEQINIKRRREEEPVDTLYIQSELHQTKRRFTDFVFQRVQIKVGSDGEQKIQSQTQPSSPSPAVSAAKRTLRSPRSVSSLLSRSSAKPAPAPGSGIPSVRATSPGAEIREEKRLAAARKEKEDKFKRALHSSTLSPGVENSSAVSSGPSSGRQSPSSPGLSVRKFQISRSSTPNLHKRTGSGVQKRRDGVAILVEKLRRKPHTRQASMVADLAMRDAEDKKLSVTDEPTTTTTPRARKRPVVNQAEKRWREERKTAISAAKQHISDVMDQVAQTQHQSNWEDESERLAAEFERIALELDGGLQQGDKIASKDVDVREETRSPAPNVLPKPALRYQPRVPAKPRLAETGAAEQKPEPTEPTEEDKEDSDGEYVYDTYIRRPLPQNGLTNPLVDLEKDEASWFRQNGIDASRPDIGVIVITPEDEEYWEHFAEDDDEEEWDSEDADSNAENNPANDYPDEELSWSDEDDEPYGYQRHCAYSEEEYDIDRYSESGYSDY